MATNIVAKINERNKRQDFVAVHFAASGNGFCSSSDHRCDSKRDRIAGDKQMGSGDYCQVNANWVAEHGRKSSENNVRKIGKLIVF